jgi:hypothetical protein
MPSHGTNKSLESQRSPSGKDENLRDVCEITRPEEKSCLDNRLRG